MDAFFTSTGGLIFIAMVALAAFLMSLSLTVPAFGAQRQAARRLRKRIEAIGETFEQPQIASLLREQYLRNLSPLERGLESLPGMTSLRWLLVQAGSPLPAYRLVMLCISLMLGGALLGLVVLGDWLFAGLLALSLGSVPLGYFSFRRKQRLERFEEQLPEALEIMTRALRAGHPFNETLKLIADDMDDPIASEFGSTFADINYGADVRSAFLGLLERTPSMSLTVMVISVLIQRETGGNLAEVLEKIAAVIRARFRFQRRVRTLSAEGRLSAWILALVPFVLFIMLMLSSPEYMPTLLDHPTGQKMIATTFVLMMVGVLWIRRIIRIDV
jgi:tight adherence protein B